MIERYIRYLLKKTNLPYRQFIVNLKRKCSQTRYLTFDFNTVI